jgi:uncharacterized SAM-binding protein YcdF (DUF218 family)
VKTQVKIGKKVRNIASALRRFIALGLALLLAFYLFGFVVYAQSVSHFARERPDAQDVRLRADGIVVLTGGADRLPEAFILLERGQGRRLLISGVNKATTRNDLRARLEIGDSETGSNRFFDCCVDLDKSARDTRGNAMEAVNWAKRHSYRSLIIVTSAYHMPRSLMELGLIDETLELKPYAVAPHHLGLERWWEYPATLRLLFSEYTKYLASRAHAELKKA